MPEKSACGIIVALRQVLIALYTRPELVLRYPGSTPTVSLDVLPTCLHRSANSKTQSPAGDVLIRPSTSAPECTAFGYCSIYHGSSHT